MCMDGRGFGDDFHRLFQLDALRRNRGSALAAADGVLFMPDAELYDQTRW